MVYPRDADPITLLLKTQARVESAVLTADGCHAAQSLPLLPGFSVPKTPTRIRLLLQQATQSVKWLFWEPVVPNGDVCRAPRVPAEPSSASALPGGSPITLCGGCALLPQRRWKGLHSSRRRAGFRCKGHLDPREPLARENWL